MKEIIEADDFRYEFDSTNEEVSFRIISDGEGVGSLLDAVTIKFNILEHDPELYDQIAMSLRRISHRIRTMYEPIDMDDL